jgi:hypothetical protein
MQVPISLFGRRSVAWEGRGMYPLVPQALSETRLVLSQRGDGCIMRCEMKRGASRRVLVGSFRSCKACSTAFAGMPVDFLGNLRKSVGRDFR